MPWPLRTPLPLLPLLLLLLLPEPPTAAGVDAVGVAVLQVACVVGVGGDVGCCPAGSR